MNLKEKFNCKIAIWYEDHVIKGDPNYKNNISTKNFLFDTKNKILKAKNVKIKDIDGNITIFDNFFSNVSKNEFANF